MKRLLSAVLSLVMLITALYVPLALSVYADGSSADMWDGSVAESFAGGDGTKENPYQIATAAQLAKLAQTASANNHYSNPTAFTGGKYYVLTADIELNDTMNADWYEAENLNEWQYYVSSCDNAFCGYLNGQGHTVKGLYVNRESYYAGLFGALGKGACIENLKIARSYIKAKNAAAVCGGLCNNISSIDVQPIVRRCHIDDSVIIRGECASGIMAYSGKPMVTESCYVGADIDGSLKEGSFYANTWTGPFTVSDSYAVHSDTTVPPYGHQAVSAENSYTTSDAKGGFAHFDLASASGEDAKTELSKLNYDGVWVTVEAMTPRLKFFKEGYTAAENEELNNHSSDSDDNAPWDGNVAESFAGGDGTEANPYQIATAGQLAKLAQTASANNHYSNPTAFTGGKYYVLTADIELNNTTSDKWYEAKGLKEWKYYVSSCDYAFCGYLNGQGHTVKGLYVNRENYYAGLFGALGKGACIENLKIENSYIKAQNAAAICGGLCNNISSTDVQPIVRRCHIDDSVIIRGANAAGIMAYSGKPMVTESCYVGADIDGSLKEGSFYANTWTGPFTVSDSYAVHSDTTVPPYGHQGVSGTNSYTSSAAKGTFAHFDPSSALGNNAKTALPKLNYKGVWVTVNGKTPKLKFFETGYTAAENEALNNPVQEPETEYYGPWNGTYASSFAGGNGTENDPYRISTPEQLALLVKQTMDAYWNNYSTLNKYYVLTNDIVINDTSKADWKEHAREWLTASVNPFGADCHSKAFAGVLNGNGHVIKGLYTNKDEAGTGAGLFVSVTQGAVIKNLGIEDSYLRADLVGAVAMRDNNIDGTNTSFIACYVDSSVQLISMHTDDNGGQGFVGGIIGYSQRPITIKYCYVKASIIGYTKNGTKWYGAFYGNMSNNSYITILGSYTACPDGVPIIGPRSGIGIFVASTYSSNNKDDSSKQILTGVPMFTVERMTGHEAASAENMANFDFENVWYTVENGTPRLRVFLDGFKGPDPETVKDPSELTVYDDAKPGDVWKPGTVASKFAGGTGTEQDPYLIETAEQLAYLLRDVIEKSAWDNYRSKDKHYKLTADIYLNDVSDPNWRKNDPTQWFISSSTHGQCFVGHLDGAGHVVYGLYINSEDKLYSSLFGSIGGNAVVENLGLADSYIYGGDNHTGGLFSYVENREWSKYKEPVISNCFVAEDVYLSGGCTGGILAASPTTITIKNCYSLATVEGAATRYGGIIGYHWYNGNYKDQDDAAQIAKSDIINCYTSDENKIPLIGTLTYLDWVNGENAYGHNAQTAQVSSVVSFGNMCGENAKEFFVGFDFANIWATVEKSTPMLRVFKNVKHKYDEHFYRTKGPVTVSFETYGGTEIASLVGETGEKLVLPTKVTRGIDVFDGWYVYDLKTWDVPFNYGYFPDDDLTLYAKWIVKGSDQDFENYPYTDAGLDGMGDDYELFRLGVSGYKTDFVHGGAKSLHRIGDSSEIQIASLADTETVKLVKGGEYELTAWVYIRSRGESTESTDLMLAYLPDCDWAYGVTNLEAICDTAKLDVGRWQQIKYTFVATEEYIGLATPGNTDMFIDDITVTPTGKKGLKNTKLLGLYYEKTVETEETVTVEVPAEENTEVGVENKPVGKDKSTTKKVIIKRRKVNSFGAREIIIISGAAVLVLAATTVLIIFLKKRKKNNR